MEHCPSDENISADGNDFEMIDDDEDEDNNTNLDFSYINVENDNVSDASCSTTGEDEEEFKPCDRIDEIHVLQ